ncbi:hypothetical protein MB02_09250 [Croceicoccus estronivorus]|uniref:cell wall hydrolase n=1 Tax=Croceicoccus estronivorus TaxID=1172626 RepID=UPI0008316ADB|nr:cell wall hydrolase [Croceicoccus estronivorus]OCC23986.1 hypothetical protein MB02_09250 [Croceicoccus estronivorus]
MSRQTRVAGSVAVAAMLATALFGAETSGAFAQDRSPGLFEEILADGPLEVEGDDTGSPPTVFTEDEVVQPVPGLIEETQVAENGSAEDETFASLADLVAATSDGKALSKDMNCLAGAIYFESKGEPLEGQLAVGRVIVNRAASPRFPSSYCGVVYQRSQFSFVRGGRMPAINKASRAWHRAKAIARIAAEGAWDSPAKGALFFHARYVSPGWRLQRIAQVNNHIFYR